MAGFDDEVCQDFVEDCDGGGKGGGCGGRAASGAVGIEQVGEVGGVEELAFCAESLARFRHVECRRGLAGADDATSGCGCGCCPY